MTAAARYAEALRHPNVRAFLHMVRVGEGTADDDGYRRLFGGRLVDDYGDHPRVAVTAGLGRHRYTSTAAGAFQFLARTWDECAAALGLGDFSPASQDLAAVFLIDRRRALADVLAGRIEAAIGKCAREWASLPGSPYGQPTKTLDQALRAYRAAGGTIAGDAPAPTTPQAPDPGPPPERPPSGAPDHLTEDPAMAPFLAAALPAIAQAIPQLARLFGSGSQVSQRNAAAAELAVGIVQQAVGARNAQEAAEIVSSDPAQATEAARAVRQRWGDILDMAEAGGGGIAGARQADAAATAAAGPWWGLLRSPSFVVACLLLPLVYLIVLSIIGTIGSADWSPDVRAAIAGTIVGSIVGGLVGYYYGQTTSRNRGAAPQA